MTFFPLKEISDEVRIIQTTVYLLYPKAGHSTPLK